MGKTKKSNTKTKESRWTGSVFILGDKQERPTKHTFIIKTSGNKKTLTVLNQYDEVWNKKEGWGKELAEKYPVFIEDKPFKGFKAFTPKSVLNNVMNLEKISIFITMRGSHQGGPRYSYKEQLVCSMMTSNNVASLKRFLSKHSKSNKKTKKGGRRFFSKNYCKKIINIDNAIAKLERKKEKYNIKCENSSPEIIHLPPSPDTLAKTNQRLAERYKTITNL